MQEDWILEKIFRHLPTKAIASTALLVCKKWRDFGLYANHRHLPSKIFDLFQKYTIKGDIKTSPFFRYVVLFEHNIFSDPGFEEMGRAFRSSPSGPMSDMYRRPFVTLHIGNDTSIIVLNPILFSRSNVSSTKRLCFLFSANEKSSKSNERDLRYGRKVDLSGKIICPF